MQNFIVNTLLFASLALALVPKSPIQEPTEIEDLNATIADSSSEHSLNKRNGMLYCGNFACRCPKSAPQSAMGGWHYKDTRL